MRCSWLAATQTILSKIPPNNSKLTYVWEQYFFHYISEGGYIYLVMADDSAGRYVSLILPILLLLTRILVLTQRTD